MGSEIPTYPNFKIIEINDKDFFDSILSKFPPYSDFSLLSLLSWNANDVNSFSTLQGNLIIKIKDYLGDGFLYSLIGKNNIDNALSVLLADNNSLSFVPEEVIKQIKNSSTFKVEHDRDSDDYILSLEDLVRLEGSNLRALRHHLNIFTRLYSHYRLRVLDITDKGIMCEINDLNKKWYLEKNFDESKQKEQSTIMDKFFNYSSYFNCIHLGLYIDDQLITYYSNEILKSGMVMGHFGAITNRDFHNCVPMMQYEVAKFLLGQGYVHQNIEQDTGLQGLRQAKLSYNPEYFLQKYKVYLA